MRTATTKITGADRWDHFLARWGVRRSAHRVEPGLYGVGRPTADSPVFVTANYTLSFDAVRSALAGIDGYVLVLDTQGVNVWCAAGKGTFGTEELVGRIEATGLAEVVSHRRLILPQLGAPGVSAQEVKRRSGFAVEFGPVRASDLPGYLEGGGATPEMRRVRFGLVDRVVLIPVELRHAFWPGMAAAVVLYFAGGWPVAAGVAAAMLAGIVVFPVVLPWLPMRDFTSKGFVLGGAAALPFAIALTREGRGATWQGWVWAAALALLAVPVAGFLTLNFTGATPLTSRTGVRLEIARYTRPMAAMAGSGILLMIAMVVVRATGGR